MRNFDKVIDRRNTNSLKHDFAVENGLPADVLPMWVADMDFKAPECVLEALQNSVNHEVSKPSKPTSTVTAQSSKGLG